MIIKLVHRGATCYMNSHYFVTQVNGRRTVSGYQQCVTSRHVVYLRNFSKSL